LTAFTKDKAPLITIQEYLAYTDGTMFNDSHCKGQIPFSWKQTAIKFGVALLFAPGTVASNKFPPKIIATQPYLDLSIPVRFVWLWIVIFLYRSKYYLAWSFAEAHGCLSGIAYNGVDERGKVRWDRVKNLDVIQLEFAENITMINAAWNSGVTRWLKQYIYLRVTPPGGKPGLWNTVMTYTVSALGMDSIQAITSALCLVHL